MRLRTLVAVTVVITAVARASFSAVLADAVVYTDPAEFEGATAGLGQSVVIDFEDIDASPINNTIKDRDPFDGNYYADLGITFECPNPEDSTLYIAPPLFWNASNSLSVFRFPFDPYMRDGTHNEDDLLVTFDPPCVAAGFTFVDKGGGTNEYVQFFDSNGDEIVQTDFPSNYTAYRAFLGIVSLDRPVSSIWIEGARYDGDDINYDDFICYQAAVEIVIQIDIKPGSYPNSINLGSMGVLPVAVLTTGEFDSSTVDPDTVVFAGASPLRWAIEDVDYDGDLDLIFHFKTQELNLNMFSIEATLTGETFDGVLIEGTDTVNVVP